MINGSIYSVLPKKDIILSGCKFTPVKLKDKPFEGLPAHLKPAKRTKRPKRHRR